MPIRVLLCDDQEVVREGMRAILAVSSDFEVVGCARHGQEALALVASTLPDVVLMDLKMPVMDGVEATRRIRAGFPAVRVLVLTTYDTDGWVLEAIRAGAAGYLLKDLPREQLFAAITDSMAGRTPVDPGVAGTLFTAVASTGSTGAASTGSTGMASTGSTGMASTGSTGMASTAPTTGPADGVGWKTLTDRERDVLALLARGLSNADIAASLYLAEGTVRNRVSSLLGKLGVSDRTQAAVFALRHGLVAPDGDPRR